MRSRRFITIASEYSVMKV